MMAGSRLPGWREGASANGSRCEALCAGEPVDSAWTTSATSRDAYKPRTCVGTRIIPLPAVLIIAGAGTSKNWTEFTRLDVDLIDALVGVRVGITVVTVVAYEKELGPITRPAELIHSVGPDEAGV